MQESQEVTNNPVERGAIDASARGPALVFFSSAVFWLFMGSIFALIAAFKFNFPEWITNSPSMTFGRVRPLHMNLMIYGWASMGATGIAVWLMPRLMRTRLAFGRLPVIACVLWNTALAAGTVGLLYGGTKGLEWLEFPNYTVILISASFVLVAVSLFATVKRRQVRHLYVSTWYLFAAFVWFPLLYIVANLPIYQGVTEAAVNWWFGHNVLGLWFTPVGLATIYYLIPKITGRPVYSYYLSILGFWTLALFYNWNGIHHLIGGPMPSWLVTTSITSSILMAVPVIVVAINHHFTIFGAFKTLKASPALRFIVYGGMSYTLVSLQGSTQALRSVNEVVHFTHYVIGHAHIGVYAFFTMVLFGSYYYILPRLTGRDFAAPRLIKVHFWLTAFGILLYWVSMQIGGIEQGLAMNNPENTFLSVVIATKPWLWARTVAACILGSGHLVFIWIYVRYRLRARAAAPSLGEPAMSEEVVA